MTLSTTCRAFQGHSASTSAASMPSPKRAQTGRRAVRTCHAMLKEVGPAPRQALSAVLAAASAAVLLGAPMDALAVSGGGGVSDSLAGKDMSGQDLRKLKLTKANLRQTNLSASNLEGVSLFGALAEDANFSNANLRNADLESGNYEGANFTNAVLEGAFVNNAQFKGVKITGSDWTDVVMRKDMQKELCSIADGTNPVTGVATRESLFCP